MAAGADPRGVGEIPGRRGVSWIWALKGIFNTQSRKTEQMPAVIDNDLGFGRTTRQGSMSESSGVISLPVASSVSTPVACLLVSKTQERTRWICRCTVPCPTLSALPKEPASFPAPHPPPCLQHSVLRPLPLHVRKAGSSSSFRAHLKVTLHTLFDLLYLYTYPVNSLHRIIII